MEEIKPNCIIIHGCPSDAEKAMNPATRTYDKHWIPWLKLALVAAGIATETPRMPDPWEPSYQKFKTEFEKYEVNENTILVGHSCGCAFLVRWLGETKREIFKLVLVAPWKIPDKDDEFKKEFYTYPIDENIKLRVNEIVMFTADNEENEGKESLKIFHQALGGTIIELKGRGHYKLGDMGTEEFPELLEKLVSFDNRKALIVPINSKHQIFIQDRRGYKKPDWGYFGGEIEKGETPLQAIIRETKEELQIDVRADELKYLGTSITPWNERKIIRYMFLYRTDQEKFNVLEGKGGHWLAFEEVRERLDNKDRFDEISDRIRKAEEKSL
ncbi:MAG: NUDIX domain-containing protein [Patescibacteria group bacterium]|nr:NUDIX domain-containing protein [Patescibacteria group bacterium]